MDEEPKDIRSPIVSASMYITKATLDGKIMRWAAVNSDTDPDSYEERMSLDLYQDFINHINNKESLPEPFKSIACSSYWCGGMPYLSVSHYPDINGQAVPGEPSSVFIDGNKLKAKGVLYNTPLGHSVFRSLQEDKNKSPDDKIRISIGFLDLAHKHGEDGTLWVRDSLSAVCPECLEGVGKKVYVRGYLVHLALTRVPVNKRTEMVLEEKSEMAKKNVTRKEDAASIVGEQEAEKIEVLSRTQVERSDALIEMSESETPEGTEELIESTEAVAPPEAAPEPVSDAPESTLVPEKSEPVVEENMGSGYTLPYGGATSMNEAKQAKEAAEEMNHVMGMFSMFQNVVWNIIDREDVPNKKSAVQKAVDEFKSMLAAKAMVEFSQTQAVSPNAEIVEKSETPDHELKPALDALLTAIDNSITFEGDVNTKLQAVQPSLMEFGQAITDYVTQKSVASTTPAQNENSDTLLNKITELIQPLSQSVQALATEVGVLKSKVDAKGVVTKSRIPQPRSLPANLVQQAQPEAKPGSIKSIIRKSVGIE